jgi:hypothetical protein
MGSARVRDLIRRHRLNGCKSHPRGLPAEIKLDTLKAKKMGEFDVD